jgi:hypothetical protein
MNIDQNLDSYIPVLNSLQYLRLDTGWGESLASSSYRVTSENVITWYPFCRRLGRPQSGSGLTNSMELSTTREILNCLGTR